MKWTKQTWVKPFLSPQTSCRLIKSLIKEKNKKNNNEKNLQNMALGVVDYTKIKINKCF
jgi:hypothetical protein